MADQDIQDLIIIKRRLSTDPEMPKGGVWKIAFADFMTAMMCFFLVMWLINAANEDTRQAVASYFNPVRLAELNRKGLENPHIPPENQPETGERTQEEVTSVAESPPAPVAERSRETLFSDPYRVLSEIAGIDNQAAAGSGSSGDSGTGGGTGAAFRDPFASEIRDTLPGVEAWVPELPVEAPPSAVAESRPSAGTLAGANVQGEPLPTPGIDQPQAAAGGPLAMSSVEQGSEGAVVEAPSSSTALGPPQDRGASSRSELKAELDAAVQGESTADHAPTVAVEDTGEGTLISLTDDADFGMFAIGSAEPQPEMVRIMQRIASILGSSDGLITIRGHTDARPFRHGNYDNWRLSTDRAQMAYYMLVRGGLDDKRVEAIEGYAERRLKLPSDPEAAENRRIEILVRGVP